MRNISGGNVWMLRANELAKEAVKSQVETEGIKLSCFI